MTVQCVFFLHRKCCEALLRRCVCKFADSDLVRFFSHGFVLFFNQLFQPILHSLKSKLIFVVGSISVGMGFENLMFNF